MDKKIPRVTIGAVVFNNNNELLLLKSKKWHDRYILPCGHVEFGETLIEAVKREVKEETNLQVNNVEFLRYDELIKSSEFHDTDRHFVSLNFKCIAENSDIILNDEAQSYIWVNLNSALKLNTDSLTRLSLEKLKK
ncbi:MAG: NUDIX domain-containing protein [Nanoarchaeota archaeon]|nr:NUDIX domain-containing protein [Nanoarchaeota archaeon]MBU1631760.1 NUDIX domain-containing protein [Nanoarchaeota archaeon]MBU1876044.1 NUDIX domain-containing protein [Nanoarchaeota archaeon]